MIQELITASEVIEGAPVKRDYPTNNLCITKDNIVLDIFRKCFSTELLNALIADKVTVVNPNTYDPTDTYNEGVIVVFDGVYYESLIDNNGDPLASDNWEVVKKFQKDCYNDLWYSFLKKLLAYRIIYSSIEYTTWQAGSKGLTQFVQDDSGIASASYKAYTAFKASLWDDSIIIFDNMVAWLKDEDNADCFTGITLFSDTCGVGCNKKQRRRIAFRI